MVRLSTNLESTGMFCSGIRFYEAMRKAILQHAGTNGGIHLTTFTHEAHVPWRGRLGGKDVSKCIQKLNADICRFLHLQYQPTNC